MTFMPKILPDKPLCKRCNQIHYLCGGHRKKRNGEQHLTPCNRPAAKGKTNCKLHNAHAKVGVQNHKFIHGRYSKVLPERLAHRLHTIQNDNFTLTEPHNLTPEIHIVLLRLTQLTEKLNENDSTAAWQHTETAFNEIKLALKNGDANKLKAALNEMETTIKKTRTEQKTWHEIFNVQKHYQKLVESERRRLVETKTMLSVDEAVLMFSLVLDAINRRIIDGEQKNVLRNEILLLGEKVGLMKKV